VTGVPFALPVGQEVSRGPVRVRRVSEDRWVVRLGGHGDDILCDAATVRSMAAALNLSVERVQGGVEGNPGQDPLFWCGKCGGPVRTGTTGAQVVATCGLCFEDWTFLGGNDESR
jgi:hypothetical protein